MMPHPGRCMESLEGRTLLAAVYPTAYEQYLVELINRGRANPTAEAQRYGIDLNEGLAAGTISTAAKQPLAINPYITDAARRHSQWMIDTDTFSHTGSGGTTPGNRMTNAGYSFSGSWSWGENIAWTGQTGSAPELAAATSQLHRNLFVDSGVAGRGHRINLMSASFREMGGGIATGLFQGYNSVMATEDFAYSGSGYFLTGVAYNDTSGDRFYTPGEGLGAITVTARRLADNVAFQATTWSAGGYSLKLSAGTYAVTASGAGLGTINYGNITIGSANVKADFTPSTQPPGDTTPPKASRKTPTLTRAGGTTYSFTVIYSDNVAVDVSDFDAKDILINGPNYYRQYAKFIKVNINGDGTPRTATYRITAPGGVWDIKDNGTYSLTMRPTQVSDTSNNYVPAFKLGTFKVAILASAPLAAPQAAAPAVESPLVFGRSTLIAELADGGDAWDIGARC